MTTVYLRVGVWFLVATGLTYSVFWPRPILPPQTVAPVSSRIWGQKAAFRQLLERLLHSVEPQPAAQAFIPLNSSFLMEEPSTSTNRPGGTHQLTIEEVKRRGHITILMHHSPASYFLHRGRQMGFEYELAKGFAKDLGVELETRTPPPDVDIVSWLHEGKGDIVAGLVTADGFSPDAVAISSPYFETTAEIVTRNDQLAPQTASDLAGKPVAVPRGSIYPHTLQAGIHAITLPPILPLDAGGEATEAALGAVVHGRAVATVIMNPFTPLARAMYPGLLRTAWSLPHPVRLVWAVRPGQEYLLQAVNTYLDRASRSGLKKILAEKYFHPPSQVAALAQKSEGTLAGTKRLSRYDRTIARYAEEAGFDWRLVAALIFEESRFDHRRVSEAGAYGLMQIMPFTAQLVGARNYRAPGDNIAAGVKYLQWLARRFPQGQRRDRLALILASYVMGLGHVEDAQRLARLLGDDPHCWHESMEQVLPLLEDPAYHPKTLFGYAQGREAVRYTNAILKRYEIYSRYIDRDLDTAEVPTLPTGQAASAAG
ncbi:MAG: transporter substrate-binding domain-containing protein [Candidatus Binatia bacterium]